MQYQLDMRFLKAIFTSFVIIAVSFAFAFPAQAATYAEANTHSMEATEAFCTSDTEGDHQVETDCCDKQPCPQNMDCGIDCVAQQVGSTALLKAYILGLHQDKSGVRSHIVKDAFAYLIAFDAPPPRG
ncbi:MAG: hypothetical protein JKY46_00415 [Robiginitomaculum sp.]|nr:hypothetical protein [Robiginitomaculum sp.]